MIAFIANFIDEIILAISSLFSVSDRLSDHYSLADLTITQRKDLQDVPSLAAQENLRQLANFLERLRGAGFEFKVTSAYRSPALNRIVGGVHESAHLEGRAVDLITQDKQALVSFIRQFQNIQELVVYDTHVHIAIRTSSTFA